MSKSRTPYADQGKCIICGEPGARHSTAGAPLMHSTCHAMVERIAFDPWPGDEAFVARCDAIREETLATHRSGATRDGARVSAAMREQWESHARNKALEVSIFYVPTHIVEDCIMGVI